MIAYVDPKEIIVPTGEHSCLGPSGSKRWIHCPGSVNASVDAADDESIYAASGSATHYLSELARHANKPALDWLDYTFVSGKYKFVVDEAMAESAQEFIDWCEESPGEVLIEQRIDFSDYMPASTVKAYGKTFGTLDDARLADGVVTITDFKDGQGVQEFAKENTQLLLQALGVLVAFGYLYDIKGFNLRISQPRLSHKDQWPISTEDLLEWAKKLHGYGQAVELGIDFAAGKWCQFCRIRKKCMVRANTATQSMLDEGEFEDLDNLEVHAMRARNAAQFLTNDMLAKILPALDIFRAWIKDMETRAISSLIAKQPVGDYKLVEGRSNRKIVNETQWVEKLRSLNVEPYQKPKPTSVSVAEKELGKKEFERRFKRHEDWVKPPGKPKLAPGDDKRPAMDTTSVNEFEDLDADE